MAAPRATQFIALRNLARGSQQVRHLHMTGPATYASPMLHRERPVLNFPRDIVALRAECKRRNIDPCGGKSELIARLNANELAHSRAFSTAIQKPSSPRNPTSPAATTVREFNTSRELKTIKDSSPLDFNYFPSDLLLNPHPSSLATTAPPRVPIISPTTPSSTAPLESDDVVVMKPQINVMSADAVFLPMAESHDGHAMNIDFHAMAERVSRNLRRTGRGAEQQAGMVKQMLGDMVDDVVGLKKLGRA